MGAAELELLAETVKNHRPAKVSQRATVLPEDVTRSQSSRWQGVALNRAIEARIGDRRGQRTDQLPGICGEVPKGMETAEYAALRRQQLLADGRAHGGT